VLNFRPLACDAAKRPVLKKWCVDPGRKPGVFLFEKKTRLIFIGPVGLTIFEVERNCAIL
jgi:hypothetical protein